MVSREFLDQMFTYISHAIFWMEHQLTSLNDIGLLSVRTNVLVNSNQKLCEMLQERFI